MAASERDEFDVIVVGGGTAGCALAARLAESAEMDVCLVEGGYDDRGVDEIETLARWSELLGSRYDYDYRIEAQARGNGAIHHSRGKMLGGCSAHNTAIAFIPPDRDFRAWADAGASGWDPQGTAPYFARVEDRVNLERSDSGNACVEAFLASAETAGYPRSAFEQPFDVGAGWFRLNKRGGRRESSAIAYLRPLLASAAASALRLATETPVYGLVIDGTTVRGVQTSRGFLRARREVVLCAGAFDTPKLLMLSGIGPASHLRAHGIDVVADRPGVGAHLLDHPEGVIVWEAARPVPAASAQRYEAGLFARVDDDADWPDLMFHFGTEAFDMHTRPAGYPTADNAFSFTPNVTRARSEGAVWLRSAQPQDPPHIDFRYFTDAEGYDERIMVEGLRRARDVVSRSPLSEWAARELAPGSDVTRFDDLAAYMRRTHNTVYHPAGTAKMGDPADHEAVVGPDLRVLGVDGLRVADASVFPRLVSVNPCLTCMMIGEKCADLVR